MRLCVVATNVAETSITISNVKYIIDCGKVNGIDQLDRSHRMNLGENEILRQADGRVDLSHRVGIEGFGQSTNGSCRSNSTRPLYVVVAARQGTALSIVSLSGYRLYSSAVFNDSFAEYTSPEIVRKPVEDLVLQLKSLNIDRLTNFPFPTPPEPKAIHVAEEVLIQLNALDASSKAKTITDLGRRISAYPINPRYGKMLVIAQENQGLLPFVIAVVAALSVNEVLTSGNVMIQKVESIIILLTCH